MRTFVDVDAVVAAADLVARSGGREFEVGHLEDDVPVEKARWYAQARFRGAVLVADEKTGPDEAADALARRILSGAQCPRCNQPVTSTIFLNSGCYWHRDGKSWVRGCDGKRERTRREGND